ncbi:MAG TPA: type 1 glutamine amidotransferase [Spirochaetota bacterium]|nr:type 1 glutamine amidotransferase [Spirochaetota bacterium]
MRVHVFQHVLFEGPAAIGEWMTRRAATVTYTRFFETCDLPDDDEIDWLIVMGGPMGVYDESEHPWLRDETRFIERAIAQGKTVIGICLGAQLIASSLGARVFRNEHREIGWFDITRTDEAAGHLIGTLFPERITAFHWHGDTFDIPRDAVRLAGSDACPNQAFAFGDRVLALQCHIESTAESIESLLVNCANELTRGPYLQDPESIRSGYATHGEDTRALLHSVLDALARDE